MLKLRFNDIESLDMIPILEPTSTTIPRSSVGSITRTTTTRGEHEGN